MPLFPECSRRKENVLKCQRVASKRLPALLELSDSNSTSRQWKVSNCILLASCLGSLLCFLSQTMSFAIVLASKSVEGRKKLFHQSISFSVVCSQQNHSPHWSSKPIWLTSRKINLGRSKMSIISGHLLNTPAALPSSLPSLVCWS